MSGGGDAGEEEAGARTSNVFGEPPIPPIQLNLTALMDILSNLLFFLLAAFGATIVMVINGTVPVQSAEDSDVSDNQAAVTVSVSVNTKGFTTSLLGSAYPQEELDKWGRQIVLNGKNHDYVALGRNLQAIKHQFPKSDTVILTPEPGLRYEILVKTMDTAREYEKEEGNRMRTLALFPTVVVSTVVK